jgi:hypothetical protein
MTMKPGQRSLQGRPNSTALVRFQSGAVVKESKAPDAASLPNLMASTRSLSQTERDLVRKPTIGLLTGKEKAETKIKRLLAKIRS